MESIYFQVKILVNGGSVINNMGLTPIYSNPKLSTAPVLVVSKILRSGNFLSPVTSFNIKPSMYIRRDMFDCCVGKALARILSTSSQL